MTMTDPIADMLTRIRNAVAAHHDVVSVPASKVKIAMARVLMEEGFIEDFEVLGDPPKRAIKMYLRYTGKKVPMINGLRRVSKPGLRVYVQRQEIPRVHGGMGIAILSTSKGILTGQQAWRRRVGGEVLCNVW